MDVKIEHTILIKHKEDGRLQRVSPICSKVMDCLSCMKIRRQRDHDDPDRQKKTITKVRFREPNQVEPINRRQPSWCNYDNWSPDVFKKALDDFIHDTLVRVSQTMMDSK